MDISGVLVFLQGLFASTLVLLAVLTGSAQQLISSYVQAPAVQNLPAPIAAKPLESTSTVPATAVATTSTKIATSTQKIVTKPAPVKPVAVASTPSKQNQTPLVSPDQINSDARKSIVNILCTTAVGNTLQSVSGSGVVVDARGVILTNAHVAQYFLLRDYPAKNTTDCVIRTGSPAQSTYRAELLYLPPAWIDANASQITAEHAVGTGENDYAILHIIGSTNPKGSIPSYFDHFVMSGGTPNTGDSALIAGYPAGFLDGMTLEQNLYPTSAFTTIGQLYAFDARGYVDAVSLGGTVVAQGGSSGGAVVRSYDGELEAMIATASTGTTTASRDLHAITIAHIDRSLRSFGQGGLAEFLSGDLSQKAADFAAGDFEKEKQKLIQATLSPAR